MRMLIVGAGSVGGYFGGRLAQVGRDVTFLVRPARARQLREFGLRILSPHGDLTLQPALVTAGDIAGPYDLILLSVKSYTLETALDDFAPAVGPDTMILPVLNGMRQLELLTQRFGSRPVIGGVALIVSEIDGQGRIVQRADIQRLAYGELAGGISERIRLLDAVLQGAGFEAHASPDIAQAMWEKWVQLASLGALTCLMRGTIGNVVAAEGGLELSRAMIAECAAVSSACGHLPSEEFLKWHTELMTQAGSPLASSMYRDMRKGVRVEAEHILGDLLLRGAARRVSVPLLEAALVSLRVYQQSLGTETHA
jgi:2-dehydropantoate 2-reductase